MPDTLAAIDIGTNSIHMVLARPVDRHHFEVLTRERAVVRLGSGGGDLDRLEPAAMDRGIAALIRCARLAADRSAHVVAVATSAVREAKNGTEFVRRAQEEAGVAVEVISGREEARLIHLGVLQSLPVYDRQLVVVDIGGGSTEVLYGYRDQVRAARSFKLGAIRLTRAYFPEGVTSKDSIRAARRHVRSTLAAFVRRVKDLPVEIAVGCSGTIQAIALVALASAEGPTPNLHGTQVGRDRLVATIDMLLGIRDPGERAAVTGLPANRADIIAGGGLVLREVLTAFDLPGLTLSDAALREGLLLDQWQRLSGGDLGHLGEIRRNGVEALMTRADDEPEHARRVCSLALEIFDGVQSLMGFSAHHRELLEAAALLANVGLFVSHSAHHRHSYYLIRHSDRLSGFNDHELELVAQVARYHRKSRPSEDRHPEFAALTLMDRMVVRGLAGILRVAIGFDRSHAGWVEGVDVEVAPAAVTLRPRVREGSDADLERYAAQDRVGLLAEVLGRSVVVV